MGGIYFEDSRLKIINDDVLTTETVKADSIDLIVTSPPYDLDIKYGGYDDNLPYEDYLRFNEKWITRCFGWLKDDGRFCLNIPLTENKGGQRSVGADLTVIAKGAGFKYHSTIVWNKSNVLKRTAWGSFKSASAPYVIAPVELVVVFYKRDWKKTGGTGLSDITREEFIAWTSGLWTFSGEHKRMAGGHPASFPLELPKRCIKLFSYVGDVVLDPFLGSGSTMVETVLNGRKGVGIEINPEYCKIARNRMIREAHIFERKLWE